MQIFPFAPNHSLLVSFEFSPFLARFFENILKSLGFISCTISSAMKKLSAWMNSRDYLAISEEKCWEIYINIFIRKYRLTQQSRFVRNVFFETCKKFFWHRGVDGVIRFFPCLIRVRCYMRVKIHACPFDAAHLSALPAAWTHSSNPSEQNYELMNTSPPTIAGDARYFASACTK